MKEIFKKLIKEFQEYDLPEIIGREYSIDEAEEITTLIGIRRSGKTYLFFQKIKELLSEGVNLRNIIFINFEDERLNELKTKDLHLLFEAYYELYPTKIDEKLYLFFDEIHAAPKWNLFLKRLYEKKKYKIYITGSSSKLLSKEIATELRGRTLSKFIYPLSFKEYLKFNDFNPDNNISFSKGRFKMKKLFKEYTKFGGFPQISLYNNYIKKEQLLSTYLELILYKDLTERYNIRRIDLLKDLVKYLVTNISKKFSLNNFYNNIKKQKKVSKDAVSEYFSYLQEVGFFYVVPKFSYSLKHQLSSTKKVYVVDLGFKNLFGFNFSKDKGRIIENIIFMSLIREGHEIYFYEEKYQCDFVVKEKDKVIKAIQVCYNLNENNRKREINGLLEAMGKFDLNTGLIITFDHEETLEVDDKTIKMVAVWKYLI